MENLVRKLDLTSLRLFVAVCQEMSIAGAAQREFIAPSAVSRRIADLEALIGLPLIERHTRGVRITSVGQTVLRHAHRLISDVEAMGAEISRLHAGMKGHVRIAANLSAIVQFLPEDIAAFQRLFPDVEIDLQEQHTGDVINLVRDRAADFGICNHQPNLRDLSQMPYRNDSLAVMLPASHPKAALRNPGLRDLVDETFVGLGANSALTQLLDTQAQTLGKTIKVRMQVTTLDALCRMTHAGLGIAIMPQRVAELYLHSLDVVVRPLSDDWAQRALSIVLPDQASLPACASALVNFLGQRG